MLSSWTTLPLLAGDGGIIIRYDFAADSCTVQLSDLESIFSESLSRDQIIERAEDEDSCIDPSSGEDQMHMLLSKLESALGGKPGTEVQLNSPSARRKNLRISIELPDPLPQLKWSFRLKPDTSATVGQDVLRPVLATAYARQEMVSQLVELIGDKDMAITKMLDKLDTSGIDLSAIFPAAVQSRSKKQIVKRSQVVQHTKGLAPFDRQQWQSNVELSGNGQITFEQLVKGAFTKEDQSVVQQLRVVAEPPAESEPKPMLKKRESTLGGSDGFQRQTTPPHLKQSSLPSRGNEPSAARDVPDNASTASEASPSPPPVQNTSRPRLGQLGGARKKQPPSERHGSKAANNPSRSRSKSPSTAPAQSHGRSRPEETFSPPPEPQIKHEASSQLASSPPESPPPVDPSPEKPVLPPQSRPSKSSKLGKLGKLGGLKGRPGPAQASSATSSHVDVADDPKSHVTRKTEDGSQGEEDEITASQILPSSPVESQQSTNTRSHKSRHEGKEDEREEEESAEQKANRKREELKRRLEPASTSTSTSNSRKNGMGSGAATAGGGKRRRF